MPGVSGHTDDLLTQALNASLGLGDTGRAQSMLDGTLDRGLDDCEERLLCIVELHKSGHAAHGARHVSVQWGA